jgi:hypothetical protein
MQVNSYLEHIRVRITETSAIQPTPRCHHAQTELTLTLIHPESLILAIITTFEILFGGMLFFFFLLSLAPQPSLDLGFLLKIRQNFLESSQQFSFFQGRVVSPTPNPHPGGPGLCIYIP